MKFSIEYLRPFPEIFSKISVDPVSGCWLWTGGKHTAGYGMLYHYDSERRRKEKFFVHRVVYTLFVGRIPSHLEIDHLCRVPACCCPDHLEAVTHRTNLLRGNAPAARNARVTHCPKGHPYSGDNLHVYKGTRHCRKCNAAQAARRRALVRKERAA